MQLKPFNSLSIAFMMGGAFLILFLCSFLEFPSISTSIQPMKDPNLSLSLTKSTPDPFTNLISAFKKWDSQVGCAHFRGKHHEALLQSQNQNGSSSSLQQVQLGIESECREPKVEHISVMVKGWTWIPDNLDNLYSCPCGLSCLWTKSSVLADKPDALLFETTTPPLQVPPFFQAPTVIFVVEDFSYKGFSTSCKYTDLCVSYFITFVYLFISNSSGLASFRSDHEKIFPFRKLPL